MGVSPCKSAPDSLLLTPYSLLLTALAVRLWASWKTSAYLDEAFMYYVAAQGPAGIVTACKGDFILPGFYFPLWPLAAFTANRFVLRLPSVLAGAALAGVIVLVGKRLSCERAGWAAGWLYALAYPVWMVDAQIRGYGWLDLAGMLALLWWLEGRRKAQAGVFLVLPWLHVMGAAWVAGWAFYGVLRRDRRLVLAAGLGLALFAPWLVYTFSGPTSYFQRQSRSRPSALDLLTAAGFMTGVPAWVPSVWLIAGVGCLGLGLVAAGLWRSRERLLLSVLLVAPLALALVAALRGTQEFQARYLVPVAGLAYLLAFQALPGRAVRWACGLVVAVNVATAGVFPFSPRLWNQDWDGAARWIEAYQRPGDLIAVYTPYSLLALNYAYAGDTCYLQLNQQGVLDIRYTDGYRGVDQTPLVPALLGPALEGRRVFLVLNQEGPGGREIREWFAARCEVERELQLRTLYSWGTIEVFLLRPR